MRVNNSDRKIGIASVECFEGPAYQFRGEDGYPSSIIIPVIIARDFQGNIYQLPNDIRYIADEDGFYHHALRFTLFKGRQLVEKILAKGIINERFWVKLDSDRELQEYLVGSYGWVE